MASKVTAPAAQSTEPVLTGPVFDESEWPAPVRSNPMAAGVASIVGTDRVLSITAPDETTKGRYVNQLHRAGADLGVTVRTRVTDTPDGRFVVRFKAVDKQTRKTGE